MAKVIVGIDLGTTFSAIAYINELTQTAEIIVSPEQERTTASAVLFKDEGGVEVGELAKRNAMFEPDKVVEFVKREMGKSKDVEVSAGGWSFEFSGKKYSAQEISAYILKKLKKWCIAIPSNGLIIMRFGRNRFSLLHPNCTLLARIIRMVIAEKIICSRRIESIGIRIPFRNSS